MTTSMHLSIYVLVVFISFYEISAHCGPGQKFSLFAPCQATCEKRKPIVCISGPRCHCIGGKIWDNKQKKCVVQAECENKLGGYNWDPSGSSSAVLISSHSSFNIGGFFKSIVSFPFKLPHTVFRSIKSVGWAIISLNFRALKIPGHIVENVFEGVRNGLIWLGNKLMQFSSFNVDLVVGIINHIKGGLGWIVKQFASANINIIKIFMNIYDFAVNRIGDFVTGTFKFVSWTLNEAANILEGGFKVLHVKQILHLPIVRNILGVIHRIRKGGYHMVFSQFNQLNNFIRGIIKQHKSFFNPIFLKIINNMDAVANVIKTFLDGGDLKGISRIVENIRKRICNWFIKLMNDSNLSSSGNKTGTSSTDLSSGNSNWGFDSGGGYSGLSGDLTGGNSRKGHSSSKNSKFGNDSESQGGKFGFGWPLNGGKSGGKDSLNGDSKGGNEDSKEKGGFGGQGGVGGKGDSEGKYGTKGPGETGSQEEWNLGGNGDGKDKSKSKTWSRNGSKNSNKSSKGNDGSEWNLFGGKGNNVGKNDNTFAGGGKTDKGSSGEKGGFGEKGSSGEKGGSGEKGEIGSKGKLNLGTNGHGKDNSKSEAWSGKGSEDSNKSSKGKEESDWNSSGGKGNTVEKNDNNLAGGGKRGKGSSGEKDGSGEKGNTGGKDETGSKGKLNLGANGNGKDHSKSETWFGKRSKDYKAYDKLSKGKEGSDRNVSGGKGNTGGKSGSGGSSGVKGKGGSEGKEKNLGGWGIGKGSGLDENSSGSKKESGEDEGNSGFGSKGEIGGKESIGGKWDTGEKDQSKSEGDSNKNVKTVYGGDKSSKEKGGSNEKSSEGKNGFNNSSLGEKLNSGGKSSSEGKSGTGNKAGSKRQFGGGGSKNSKSESSGEKTTFEENWFEGKGGKGSKGGPGLGWELRGGKSKGDSNSSDKLPEEKDSGSKNSKSGESSSENASKSKGLNGKDFKNKHKGLKFKKHKYQFGIGKTSDSESTKEKEGLAGFR